MFLLLSSILFLISSVDSQTCSCGTLGDCVTGKILTASTDKQEAVQQCIAQVADTTYQSALTQCFGDSVDQATDKVQHVLCEIQGSNICSGTVLLSPGGRRSKRHHGGGRGGKGRMQTTDATLQGFFDCKRAAKRGTRTKRGHGGRGGRRYAETCASELSCSLDYSNYVRPSCDNVGTDRRTRKQEKCLCLQAALPNAGITCGSTSTSSSTTGLYQQKSGGTSSWGGNSWGNRGK